MAVSDTALNAATKAAPHFSIVSLVPAAVFTSSLVLLLAARPWTGAPDFASALKALAHPTLGQVAAALVIVVVVALVLHPLQFTLIQLMEGYWGVSRPALVLASRRVAHHRSVLDGLAKTASDAEFDARDAGPFAVKDEVELNWRRNEATRLRGRYPTRRADVMPTALGNVLRRHERSAGTPYGLSLVVTAPHLMVVGDGPDVEYVRDQRTQLDLAARMVVTCAMLSVAATLLLLPCGWWLLLAAVPYLLALAFYRGACTVAQEYGASLYTLIDLNRTALYERFGVPLPKTLAQERLQNAGLMAALRDRYQADLDLVGRVEPEHKTPRRDESEGPNATSEGYDPDGDRV
jgi:hypothetical protein